MLPIQQSTNLLRKWSDVKSVLRQKRIPLNQKRLSWMSKIWLSKISGKWIWSIISTWKSRSEERRVGKEWRGGWAPDREKKRKTGVERDGRNEIQSDTWV